MKVMIYSSRHGYTRSVLDELNRHNESSYKIVSIDEIEDLDLKDIDEVLIGGALYHSKLSKALILYIEENVRLLMTKKVILFLVGLKTEKLQKAFELNFPQCLLDTFPRFYLGGCTDHTNCHGMDALQLKRIMRKYGYSRNAEIVRLDQILYYLENN